MEKILVAVGTTRRPKLNAVWEALSVIGPTLHPTALFEVVAMEVASGVGHTPLSREELMVGARQRAETLVKMSRERPDASGWKFFVGLEGGLDIVYIGSPGGHGFSRAENVAQSKTALAAGGSEVPRLVFLENWAYVTDGARGAFGQSGAILIPDSLAKRVVDDGVELAEAIDAFACAQGIRDQQGAWGVLSRNLITRQDAFRTAVVNAFAPFFNAALYR